MDLKDINSNNIERILTYIEAITITKKEYRILKQFAEIEREKLENQLNARLEDNNPIDRKYIELRISSTEYSQISDKHKEIMLANAVLPDDKKIADMLSNHGFTIDQLKIIIRFRSLLNKLTKYDSPLDKEEKQKFEAYKIIVKLITNLFKENFKYDNQTVILNRICEMLVTCPELFETKPNIRKRI